jgi:hypothetical protein
MASKRTDAHVPSSYFCYEQASNPDDGKLHRHLLGAGSLRPEPKLHILFTVIAQLLSFHILIVHFIVFIALTFLIIIRRIKLGTLLLAPLIVIIGKLYQRPYSDQGIGLSLVY